MKEKKGRRSPLDPDDVIVGRARPAAPELIALIRDVNPTGRGLPPRQTAQRYAQKSRLQSVLVRRFQDEIDVVAKPDEPGIASLLHRPSGLDACHALVEELDEDARAWVQLRIDLETSELPLPPEPRARAPRAGEGGEREARRRVAAGDLDVPGLLEAGREAALAYEFEVARERFEAALARSGGAAEPASALLSLLVDHLAADEEALALEGRIEAGALLDPEVRVLLALAAARRSDRERALRLLKEPEGARGGRSARLAEVRVALAQGAIEAGRLDEAADDLARARERDPTRPELLSLSNALVKRRAAVREPAEAELSRLFAAGDIAGAERAARELVARWPDSEAGRRIARAVDEHRRREQAEQLLASAREALDGGEAAAGLTLLRRALAGGLQPEDAAWAERRIAALEAEARAREELARLEEVRRLIAAGNLARGLPAYAGLDAQGRQAVRGSSGPRLLLWLDELAPPGASARAKAAIPAVVALGRAAELAAREPSAALDALGAHAKVLQGFEPAEEVSREARRALAELRRSAARRGVEAARRALAEGKPDRADERLRDAPLAELPDVERAAADELWASIRRLLDKRILVASIEQLRREGDELRALGVLGGLLALVEDAERPRFEALRSELRADVQRRFCVQIEDLAGDTELSSPAPGAAAFPPLWDIDVSANITQRTLLPAPACAGLADHVLVLAQTRDDGVFLRIIDAGSARLRARVMLRTPAPVELLAAHLFERRLFLVGRYGSLLEISLDSFHVERWLPNVIRNGGAFRRTLFGESSGLPSIPGEMIENTALAPDGRSLWANVILSEGGSPRRGLHVLDLAELRLIREIREPRGERVYVRAVHGLRVPHMAIIRDDDQTRLLDTRGQPSFESVVNLSIMPSSLTACPDGERIFGLASDPAGPDDPHEARWGWVEIAQGVPSPLRMLDGLTAVRHISAATSLSAEMTFALIEIEHRGCELIAFREGAAGLEVAYRTPLPRRSALLGDPSSRRAAALIEREDRMEIVELGAEPPAPSRGPAAVVFQLPILSVLSAGARMIECQSPTGERLAAATALGKSLRRESPSALLRRLDAARRRGGVEELLNLEAALLMIQEPRNAGLMGAAAWQRFPQHPRVRLSQARPYVNMGDWSTAQALLSSVDPGGIHKSERKHLYHSLGLTLLMQDKPEEALAPLEQAERCEEGLCDVGELIALCAPLSDTERAWTPEQALLRDLIARIASADAALGRGDALAARRALDCPLVWEAYEIQSFARLSEACLLLEGEAGDPFRRALTLLSFCDLFEARGTYARREMPLPRVAWSTERLSEVAEKARAWAEEALTRNAGERTTAPAPPRG